MGSPYSQNAVENLTSDEIYVQSTNDVRCSAQSIYVNSLPISMYYITHKNEKRKLHVSHCNPSFNLCTKVLISLSKYYITNVVTNIYSTITLYCSRTNANKMPHIKRCDCCYQFIFFMNGKIHRKSENMVKRYLQRK